MTHSNELEVNHPSVTLLFHIEKDFESNVVRWANLCTSCETQAEIVKKYRK